MPRRHCECDKCRNYSDCSSDSYSSDDSSLYRKRKTSKSHKKNEIVRCDKCKFDSDEEEKSPTVRCDRCSKKHKKEKKQKCCKEENKLRCDNGCKDGKYFFITLN